METVIGNLGEQLSNIILSSRNETGQEDSWVEPIVPTPAWGNWGGSENFVLFPVLGPGRWNLQLDKQIPALPTVRENQMWQLSYHSERPYFSPDLIQTFSCLHKLKQQAIKRVPIHQEKISRKENK